MFTAFLSLCLGLPSQQEVLCLSSPPEGICREAETDPQVTFFFLLKARITSVLPPNWSSPQLCDFLKLKDPGCRSPVIHLPAN